MRVLLLLTLATCCLGWVQKAPCRTHSWSKEYQYTRMCYSDVYALYFAEGLADGKVPYRDHAVEYPPLTGLTMWVAAELAQPLPPARRPAAFFDITALILTGCALVMTYTTARLAGPRRPWDAAMVAVAPVLALHAFTNWDLLAVALAGLGLLAWSRRRPVLAGAWIGLGVAAKRTHCCCWCRWFWCACGSAVGGRRYRPWWPRPSRGRWSACRVGWPGRTRSVASGR